MDVVKFTQKNLDQIIQLVFQAQTQKRELSLSGDKFKAQFFDVYYDRSHIEYYNFCQ